MAIAYRQAVGHGRLGIFHQFVLEHEGMVYNVAYRILGDQGLAVQATRAAFTRSFSAFTDFRGESARLWLMGIVVGICQHQLRREVHPHADLPAEHTADQQCLGALPLEQRITVVLSDIEKLSYREISRVMGVSVDVVRCRLSQGRAILRETLLARGEIAPKDCPRPT